MPRIRLSVQVEQDYKAVFTGFTEDLFKQLKPPGVRMKLVRFDGCQKGDIVQLELKVLGFIKQMWKSTVTDSGKRAREFYFVDEGKGAELPFFLKKWKHRHRMIDEGERGTTIIDDFEYTAPLGMNWLLYPVLWAQFAYRKAVYKRVFKKPSVDSVA